MPMQKKKKKRQKLSFRFHTVTQYFISIKLFKKLPHHTQ